MAFRRRSLLKKPGLKENLRLWLSIEVGELASFTEQDLKRVVSGTHFGNEGFPDRHLQRTYNRPLLTVSQSCTSPLRRVTIRF